MPWFKLNFKEKYKFYILIMGKNSSTCCLKIISYIMAQLTKVHALTPPQENGIAECVIQSTFNAVRTMLHDSGHPRFLQAEALVYYFHYQNRSPHSALPHHKTPFELYYKCKPSVLHLWTWGCSILVCIPAEKQTKLGLKACKGFFVGVCGKFIY